MTDSPEPGASLDPDEMMQLALRDPQARRIVATAARRAAQAATGQERERLMVLVRALR